MKWLKVTLLAVLIFLGMNYTSIAQEVIPEEPTVGQNYGLFAGGQAATSGLGLNLKYILNDKISLKTGFETLKFNVDFNFDENDITYAANLNYQAGGFFLLADYFYTSRLYISAGASLNSFNPRVNGEAISALEYGDISVPAEDVGDFKFDIKPGMKISPYAGLGFRQFIGKQKRVVYNLETGLYYMGTPKINIEATGLLSPTADPAHGQEKYLENQIKSYKFYPVFKFNVAFKLF